MAQCFDFQINASSSVSDQFSPAKARLGNNTAWVDDINDNNLYIQVIRTKGFACGELERSDNGYLMESLKENMEKSICTIE